MARYSNKTDFTPPRKTILADGVAVNPVLDLSTTGRTSGIIRRMLPPGRPIKNELKKRASAEAQALKKLLSATVRIYLPLLAAVLLFLAVDIHAFNDLALRCSTTSGYTTLTKLFLSLGANVHANNDQPIGLATMYGDAGLVSLLLDHGADVEAQKGFPLHAAVDRGRLDLVDLLLSRGADVCGIKGALILRSAKLKRNDQILDHLRAQMAANGCPDKSLATSAEGLTKLDVH